MRHRMKLCELQEYKRNEYVTIAVNRNLSNCEIATRDTSPNIKHERRSYEVNFNSLQFLVAVDEKKGSLGSMATVIKLMRLFRCFFVKQEQRKRMLLYAKHISTTVLFFVFVVVSLFFCDFFLRNEIL